MKLRDALVVLAALGALSGCALPYTDLKSPCAGAEGSPCVRHPVNDWWLNPQGEHA